MTDFVEHFYGRENEPVRGAQAMTRGLPVSKATKRAIAKSVFRSEQAEYVLDTILALRAEVERLTAERDEGARWRREGEAELRAEVERLTDELQDCQSRAITSLHELRADNERLRRDLAIWERNGGDILLRAEVERLRALLICIELDFDASPSVRALARRALEPKP
jgi:hypothetical protein